MTRAPEQHPDVPTPPAAVSRAVEQPVDPWELRRAALLALHARSVLHRRKDRRRRQSASRLLLL